MNLILYVLLLLIILSCFGKHLNKYNCGLTSLLIIFVVVFLMTDELDKSLLISLGGAFLLSLIRCPLNIEGLENIKNEENDEDVNDNEDKSDLSDHSDHSEHSEHSEHSNNDEDKIPKYNISTEHSSGVQNVPNALNLIDSNKVDNMTPAQAQRESYKLIQSVEHLQNTMKELVPNLSAAKKVIDMYKTIKM